MAYDRSINICKFSSVWKVSAWTFIRSFPIPEAFVHIRESGASIEINFENSAHSLIEYHTIYIEAFRDYIKAHTTVHDKPLMSLTKWSV